MAGGSAAHAPRKRSIIQSVIDWFREIWDGYLLADRLPMRKIPAKASSKQAEPPELWIAGLPVKFVVAKTRGKNNKKIPVFL
jgi:hypothetical protein